MAIWQFDFYIIPAVKYDSNTEFKFDDVVDNATWEGCNINNDSIDKIVRLLKRNSRYNIDDTKTYGDYDSTCIHFYYENNVIDSIRVRLDLRSLTKEVLMLILDFTRENNALIVNLNKIIKPDINDFINELKESIAFKFVNNPINFLSNIDDKDDHKKTKGASLNNTRL